MKTIKDLKQGDPFKISEDGNLFVRGGYNRKEKKYLVFRYYESQKRVLNILTSI